MPKKQRITPYPMYEDKLGDFNPYGADWTIRIGGDWAPDDECVLIVRITSEAGCDDATMSLRVGSEDHIDTLIRGLTRARDRIHERKKERGY